MDKKRLIICFAACIFSVCLSAQPNYSYQPMSANQKASIENDMFVNNVGGFLVNDRIPIGPVNLTNVINMVSYNPVEGTRIRVSAETNNALFKKNKLLRNRLAFSVKAAYGTKDNKFKYGAGVAFNFAKKPSGVYSFPCSTLAVDWDDDTYMPSYPNYDVAYFSFGTWDRFYFASKKQLTVSFLQEFESAFAFRPFFYWQKIDDYMLYDDGTLYELLDPNEDYINKSVGIELSYTPTRKMKNLLTIFNSRFSALPTQIKIAYSYNSQEYIQSRNYNKLEAAVQHRFVFLPLALDVKILGGKIFGESDPYMYFTPNYTLSSVSNMYGFNLYRPGALAYKEYVQTYTQINLGGILLDNISFFEKFRPNEFVNFKALFTENHDPYMEMGAGIDHIFGFLGVEFIKRLSKDTHVEMPEWGFRVRCTI